MPHIESTQDSLARIARTNDDERCRVLSRLEALWEGKLYELDKRPSFWSRDVPLRERAPCVVEPIARTAGRRLVALVFGERVFPTLVADDSRLSEEQAKAVETLIAGLLKVAKLRGVARTQLTQGLKTGSVACVCKVRNSKPVVEIVPAKWCTPAFDADWNVLSLEIRYRYQQGGTHYWYRRLITETRDVTYRPAEVRDDGHDPVWVEDPAQCFDILFCPVLWHRNSPEVGDNSIDGDALACGMEDEMEALDFSLSQRHRNAQYNGEPQTVVTGLEKDKDKGGGDGRTSEEPKGVVARLRGWVTGNAGGQAATKKSPDTIWKLAPGADAKMLESSGAGAQILQGDIDGLRRVILDAFQTIIADPQSLGSGDVSARALTLMLAPMLAFADTLRDEYGDLLIRTVQMLMRLCVVHAAMGYRVDVPGLTDAVVELLNATDVPELACKWGGYFRPSWSEVQAGVTAAKAATGDRTVLSRKRAVEMLAELTGVENVEAEVGDIEAEEASGQGATTAMLGALSDAPTQRTPAPGEQAVPTQADELPVNTSADPAVTAEAQAAATGELPEVYGYGYDYDADVLFLNEVRKRKGVDPIPGMDGVTITVWKAMQQAKANAILAESPAPKAPDGA